LDVAHASSVTQALDAVIALVLQRSDAATVALKAHRESPRFCLFPMYTDLVSFVSNIEDQLAVDASTLPLKQAIQRFYKAVQPFVVAHCAGYQNIDVAHGFAIYLPTYSID